MNQKNEKVTAPIPSVGADEGQSQLLITSTSISKNQQEINEYFQAKDELKTNHIEIMLSKMRELDVQNNELYPINDIGIAKLFYDLHKDKACYVPETKCWYIWSGKRWVKDDAAYIMERCKDFAQAFNKYATSLKGDTDEMIKFAAATNGRKKRESILRDAISIEPRSLSRFDNNKLLLNCINGTFNLSTMAFQPHYTADYLTKISNAKYVEGARCERWEQFISEVMQGDVDTAKFLQKSFGYCLSGEISLECFFILYGNTTRNGKTTACETIAFLLGEYSRTVQPETLARRSNNGSTPTPDIARLKAARFLNMPEPERGLELNAALIKQLTGGDTYTGRFLHENPFEFKPEFKIFINTNHLPRTGDDTIFSSERVKLIPFERHFNPEEQDTGLKAHFRKPENLSGVLNWMIEGYRLLQLEGLSVPEKIITATKEYRQDTDIVGTFLDECLIESAVNRVQTGVLYQKYTEWSRENGYRPLNNKNFVGELRRRQFDIRRNGQRGYEIVGYEYCNFNMVQTVES